MQLVTISAHAASLPHKGSASQLAKYFEAEYDTFEAKIKNLSARLEKRT